MRRNGAFTQADIDKVMDSDLSHVTLNGKPAKIIGRMDGAATVRDLRADWHQVQFSWPTVFRIMRDSGGCFRTD